MDQTCAVLEGLRGIGEPTKDNWREMVNLVKRLCDFMAYLEAQSSLSEDRVMQGYVEIRGQKTRIVASSMLSDIVRREIASMAELTSWLHECGDTNMTEFRLFGRILGFDPVPEGRS